MSGYIGNIPVPQATQTRDVFTATSGQTSFATSGYTPGFLDVWLNGVKLVNGTDFTATNGSDVVLASGAATSDIVEVLSYSTYGVNAQTYTGGLTAKNDGAAAITADRLTSNGLVLDVQKDGTSVGGVGSEGGDSIYIGNGDAGMKFSGGADAIQPFNPATVSARDNAIDLGTTGARFKNLYLSGGVYLGGTGGENLLDDYEEGTWTVQERNGQASITTNRANYTKIGRLVYASASITVGSTSNTNTLNLTLPFASSISSFYVGGGNVSYTDLPSTYVDNIRPNIENSADNLFFFYGNGAVDIKCNQASGYRIDFFAAYQV